jgi:hypothetical protein
LRAGLGSIGPIWAEVSGDDAQEFRAGTLECELRWGVRNTGFANRDKPGFGRE